MITTERGLACIPKNCSAALFYRPFSATGPAPGRFAGKCFLYNVRTDDRQELPPFVVYWCRPAWSADRKRFAFVEAIPTTPGHDVPVMTYYDLEAGETVRVSRLFDALATSTVMPCDLQWTADGEGIRFVWSDQTTLWHVGIVHLLDSAIEVQYDFRMPEDAWPARLSPDGTQLAYATHPRDGVAQKQSLWILHLPTLLAKPIGEAGHNCDPLWSPSGRYIAYVGYSDEVKSVCVAEATDRMTRIEIPVNVGDELGQMPPIRPCWVSDDCLVYGSFEEATSCINRIYLLDVRAQRTEVLAEVGDGVLSQIVGLSTGGGGKRGEESGTGSLIDGARVAGADERTI